MVFKPLRIIIFHEPKMHYPFKLPTRKTNFFKSISEFEKIRTLGNGAFATVIEAMHLITKKKYAIKQINLSKISSIDHENILKELEIHSRVNNSFLVRLVDFWKEGSIVYLVLELCSKGNLYHYMNHNRLSEIEIKKFFMHTAFGIKYLHSQGVIMRDLKPENIVLDENMNAKLCDLGWASFMKDTAYCSIKAGTYAYMSPESLQGVLQNEKSDVWSLGILLYELYYNKEPFSGRSCLDMLKTIKTNEIDFTKPINVHAKELILSLLRFNAKDRPDLKTVFQSKFVREALQAIDPNVPRKDETKLDRCPSPLHININNILSKQQLSSPVSNVFIKHTYTPLYKAPSTMNISKHDKPSFLPIYQDKKMKMTESVHSLASNNFQVHKSNGPVVSNQDFPMMSQSQYLPNQNSRSVITTHRVTTTETKTSVFSAIKSGNYGSNFNTYREHKFSTPTLAHKNTPLFFPMVRDNQQTKKNGAETSLTTPVLQKYDVVSRTNSIEHTPIDEGRRARRIDQHSHCSFVNEPSITRNQSIVSHSPGVTIIRHFSSNLTPRTLQESTLPKNDHTLLSTDRGISKNISQILYQEPKKLLMSFNQNSRTDNKVAHQIDKSKNLQSSRHPGVPHIPQKSIDHNIYLRSKINLGVIENSIFKGIKGNSVVEENTNIYQKTAKIILGSKPDAKKPDLKMSFGGNVPISRRYQV